MSSARDCLFSTFPATLHIWRQFLHPQPEDAPCCGDRDPLTDAALALTPSLNTFHYFDKYIFSHRHDIRTAVRLIADCSLSILYRFLVHHHLVFLLLHARPLLLRLILLLVLGSCSSSSYYYCYSSCFTALRPIFGP